MGARRPSLATIVQDSLGVYSGVHWTPLESILESIETPWKSPGSGSQETQPGDYRSGLPWSLFWSLLEPWTLFWNLLGPLGLFWSLLGLLGIYSGIYWGSFEEARQWKPREPTWRPPFSQEIQPGALESILKSIGTPWNLF